MRRPKTVLVALALAGGCTFDTTGSVPAAPIDAAPAPPDAAPPGPFGEPRLIGELASVDRTMRRHPKSAVVGPLTLTRWTARRDAVVVGVQSARIAFQEPFAYCTTNSPAGTSANWYRPVESVRVVP